MSCFYYLARRKGHLLCNVLYSSCVFSLFFWHKALFNCRTLNDSRGLFTSTDLPSNWRLENCRMLGYHIAVIVWDKSKSPIAVIFETMWRSINFLSHSNLICLLIFAFNTWCDVPFLSEDWDNSCPYAETVKNLRKMLPKGKLYPVLTSRHCARVFDLVFTRARQPLRVEGNFCRPSLFPSWKFFWENLWHEKVNLNFWIVRRKWCCCCKCLRVHYCR